MVVAHLALLPQTHRRRIACRGGGIDAERRNRQEPRERHDGGCDAHRWGSVHAFLRSALCSQRQSGSRSPFAHPRDLSSRFHDWTLSVHCSGASWHFSLHGYHSGRHATKAHTQDGSGVLFLPRRSHHVWGCCEGSLRPHETWGRRHPCRWHGATPHWCASAHGGRQPHHAPLGQPHRLCSGAYGSKVLHSLHCTLWVPRFRMVSHHRGRSDFGFAPLRN